MLVDLFNAPNRHPRLRLKKTAGSLLRMGSIQRKWQCRNGSEGTTELTKAFSRKVYFYVSVHLQLAKRAGLKHGDHVTVGKNTETGYGVLLRITPPAPGNLLTGKGKAALRVEKAWNIGVPFLPGASFDAEVKKVTPGRIEFCFPAETLFKETIQSAGKKQRAMPFGRLKTKSNKKVTPFVAVDCLPSTGERITDVHCRSWMNREGAIRRATFAKHVREGTKTQVFVDDQNAVENYLRKQIQQSIDRRAQQTLPGL